MRNLSYYYNGKEHNVTVESTSEITRPISPDSPATQHKMLRKMCSEAQSVLRHHTPIASLYNDIDNNEPYLVAPKPNDPTIMTTETVVLTGVKQGAINWMHQRYGFQQLDEDLDTGTVLLQAPESGETGMVLSFTAAKACYGHPDVDAAHPNFVRILNRPFNSSPVQQSLIAPPHWNYQNPGNPGKPNADVSAHEAWKICRGNRDIRVAVLDDGIDISHPAFQSAIVDQKDFATNSPTVQPEYHDIHGTACAGIIASRDNNYCGLAPECSLLAVRVGIGMGRNAGNDLDSLHIAEDYRIAQAIEWAWKNGRADVLSLSWGCGKPTDIIKQAINKARQCGRGGKGCVVVAAAGNSNGKILFPASLDGVLTVGASNWWDERISPVSQDGKKCWGSCFGPELDLLAPGGLILTCDVQGDAGYTHEDFTTTFGGTSAATPHVAAAAALVLSVNNNLSEHQVREIINLTADRLSADGQRDDETGWGRLNIFSALQHTKKL